MPGNIQICYCKLPKNPKKFSKCGDGGSEDLGRLRCSLKEDHNSNGIDEHNFFQFNVFSSKWTLTEMGSSEIWWDIGR